jgi:hypothetical protein
MAVATVTIQTMHSAEALSQFSTIDALMQGIYDGAATFGDVKRYGDFGLGTVNHLDGEMLALDGIFYQITGDGRVQVGTSKALLTSVLISEAWCIVERIGNHPCETGLPENYGISVKVENREAGLHQIQINGTWAAAGATIFFPWAKSVTTNPESATSSPASVDGVTGIRLVLPSAGTFSATVLMD